MSYATLVSVYMYVPTWMYSNMCGMDLRNMPQPRESIVLIEIGVAVLVDTFYYVENRS